MDARRRLKKIEDEGLTADADALAGPEFLAEPRRGERGGGEGAGGDADDAVA